MRSRIWAPFCKDTELFCVGLDFLRVCNAAAGHEAPAGICIKDNEISTIPQTGFPHNARKRIPKNTFRYLNLYLPSKQKHKILHRFCEGHCTHNAYIFSHAWRGIAETHMPKGHISLDRKDKLCFLIITGCLQHGKNAF